MNPKRKKRLTVVTLIVLGAAAAVSLTLYALEQNINLFYSPVQIVSGEAPTGRHIRAGGMVVEGSLKRHKDSLKVSFDVTDFEETVRVEYTGILPDLFREGQGIVANGSLDDGGVFQAAEVLAKHDENYMPPEVTDALEKSAKSKLSKTKAGINQQSKIGQSGS
ncbi:MAG: cytochrome c maturation protein CcmE [Methylococcales bacterium]